MELTNKFKLEIKTPTHNPNPRFSNSCTKLKIFFTGCYWSAQFEGDSRYGRYKKYEIGDKIRHNSNSHNIMFTFVQNFLVQQNRLENLHKFLWACRKHSRFCFFFTASWKLEAIKELNYSHRDRK